MMHAEKISLGMTMMGTQAELDFQELTTGRTLLCSISGYGKTWTARRIVEQIFGKTGIIIVDVEGEYATLRDKFPFLIVGKDVPLEPGAAEFLADQIFDNNLSAIIDISDPDLDIAVGQEFIALFIDRFISRGTKEKKTYLFVLEEADELAPERGIEKSICLSQVRKLVKKGRKRGLGSLVLTQRPAFVSKFIISQCANKIVGRTEWPADLAILRKFGRIPAIYADPESAHAFALKKLTKGQFYISGDFIEENRVVQVGQVQTRHMGATPEVVPPAPGELKQILQELRDSLPEVIEKKIAPAVPKVAEIEKRIRNKIDAGWQARLDRKDKQLKTIKTHLANQYQGQISELTQRLEEASRLAAIQGVEAVELLKHPLVARNLEKLTKKERAFVELLEKQGPQGKEQAAFFLKIKPRSVSSFVYGINQKVPGVIEGIDGKYRSKLADMFPVTEEARSRMEEVDRLTTQLRDMKQKAESQFNSNAQIVADFKIKTQQLERLQREHDSLRHAHDELQVDYNRLLQKTADISEKVEPAAKATHKVSAKVIGVEAELRRKLTKFEVVVDVEKLVADESTNTGRILAIGLAGFFKNGKAQGQVLAELERRYGISKKSGGQKDSVKKALEELTVKGILDRKWAQKRWIYSTTTEFKDRVKRR